MAYLKPNDSAFIANHKQPHATSKGRLQVLARNEKRHGQMVDPRSMPTYICKATVP